jgi:RimJ/RimL family protein N-acetyltransferase
MFARTERLLLRPGWREDAPALFQAIADERIVRNLATAPWPYRLADAEAFLTRERKALDAACLIFLRTDGAPRLVGGIGFGRMPPDERGESELEFGYWIARPHWGRGIATEAGAAMIANARLSLRLPRLAAGHFLDNPASGRVLEKLGFRPTGATRARYSAGRDAIAPCRLFELDLAGKEAADEPCSMAA